MYRFMKTALTIVSIVMATAFAVSPLLAQSSPYDDPEVRALREQIMKSGVLLYKSAHDCTTSAGNLVTNCSFESGDFSGWIVKDMALTQAPLGVYPAGVFSTGFFPPNAPSHGSFDAVHAYDGGGPDNVLIQQDVTAAGGDCALEFDYRGAWQLAGFGATLPRTFDVRIEQPVGTTTFSQNIVTSAPGSTVDTGIQSATVAIPASAAAAGSARLVFEWIVPEFLTGPAHFEIDNVLLTCLEPDTDGDGVFDDDDVCPDTVIPEGVPTVRLGTNRFALVDGDGDFDTKSPNGNGPNRSYTIEDTAGCSCEQIIAAQGLGNGHTKFGCSISAMDDWVALIGN